MSETTFPFNMVCFSTNNDIFSPLSIINKFIQNTGYNNIKMKKNNILTFNYKLENEKYNNQIIEIFVHEIKNLEGGNYDICFLADSYLIIIDLESENTYKMLDIILEFMKNYCDTEKTFFILGVYKDIEKTKKELDEENIIEYLDGKKIIYEYIESNFDSIKDLVKTVDFILLEGIKKIENKMNEMGDKKGNDTQCESKCVFF